MFIKQLYTGCLSEAAYYIESEGEAAIIDPLRDIDAYLGLAKERGASIKYIFETHFHADFVSGHLELAEKTGAPDQASAPLWLNVPAAPHEKSETESNEDGAERTTVSLDGSAATPA